MNTSQLIWGVIFGSVGLGYFLYGKKQKMVIPLICGILLMIYSYFIDTTLMLVIIGTVLSILPYLIRW